jgi:uncharacterized protein YndB with AHSA1/START domain
VRPAQPRYGCHSVSTVRASIDIPASPERVWNAVMDPRRLGEWVTIHRQLHSHDEGPPRLGYRVEQRLHLRGVSLDVRWRLVECAPCRRAVWEGRGPARSRARTEYTLTTHDGVTRFDYRNQFHAPLGPIGALASRALVGGMPQREASRTLERLRALLEN